MDNLLISIGADTKEFVAGLGEVGEKTGSLGDKLGEVGVVAGVAFAGYTAAIMECVSAYRQEELIGQEVNATIVATGGIAGVTSGMIDELAESFSKSTLFSKLQVEQGEAMLVTFDQISKDTFPAATQATLDLAQHMGGDAVGAARLLGRALEDPMNGTQRLTRAGVSFTDQQKAQIETMELSGNMAGAQAIIIAAVEKSYNHMAEAAAGGTGQITVMKNAFELLAANLGEQFAPMIASAAAGMADFINWVSHNKDVVTFGAAVLGGAAALTGLVTGLTAAYYGFGVLAPAIGAAITVVKGLAVATQGLLMGPAGLLILPVVLYELYEHWNQIWPAMAAVYKAFVDNIGNVAQGLYKVLNGALHLNMDEIKAGLAQAATAFVQGGKQIGAVFSPAAAEQKRDLNTMVDQAVDANAKIFAANKKAMEAQHAAIRAHNSLVAQERKAANEVTMLELGNHSAAVVALKKKEDQILKSLADENFKGNKAALRAQLAEIRAEYDAAQKDETAKRKIFNDTYLKNDKNFQKLSTADQKAYLHAHEAALVGSMENETQAQEAVATADIQRQIKLHNTMLEEQVRYGATYAEINEAMHSAEFKGAQNAASQLQQLTQSNNAVLKGIGSVAAVADIEMKGAQGAMAAYAGFCDIPIVGPALGIAAAAAIELYSQEQAGKVLGLSRGGLIEGGIPGVDSVPAMMMPGELAVPKQNFEEVVSSVAATRNGMAQSPAQQVTVQVEIAMKGDASRVLTAQINKDKALGRYRGSS